METRRKVANILNLLSRTKLWVAYDAREVTVDYVSLNEIDVEEFAERINSEQRMINYREDELWFSTYINAKVKVGDTIYSVIHIGEESDFLEEFLKEYYMILDNEKYRYYFFVTEAEANDKIDELVNHLLRVTLPDLSEEILRSRFSISEIIIGREMISKWFIE